MNSNAIYLKKLKKDAEQSSQKLENRTWMIAATIVALAATYFTNGVYARLAIVAALLAVLFLLHLSNSMQATAPTKASSTGTYRPDPNVTPAAARPATGATASERQATINASVVGDVLSPKKGRGRSAVGQQGGEWNENFDPQSPQRISQALNSDGPVSQPTYSSSAPSLYASTNNTYVGKANMANLGYQFTGSSFSGLASPQGRNSTFSGSLVSPSATRGFQTEPTAPVWHTYHSSPPNVDIGSSPSGTYGRKGKPSLSSISSPGGVDEYDPLNEIVSRVTAESGAGDAMSDRAFSFSSQGAGGLSSPGPARTPRFGRTGMATPGVRGGGAGGAGLTEDRLEHVLGKFLEAQEQIVQECAQEIVAQLTMRAAAGGGAGSAGSAGGALLQSQDDVIRVQALLLLQSDRQVLQSRRALTLPDLLQHCRVSGIKEDLLQRYEAAAAVLLSPNRSTLGTSAGASSVSGGGGFGSTSGGYFSPSASAAAPPSLYRANSGSGTFSSSFGGAGAGSSLGFGYNTSTGATPRATAASFGKGWMSPAPAVEPFASSSSASSSGAATFTSTRRGRRY